MTITPHASSGQGWEVDVVVPPNNTTLTIDLMPQASVALDLRIDEQEIVELILGGEGPMGPPGPTEATSVVLQAPDGSRWALVVDNSGVLSTVQVVLA